MESLVFIIISYTQKQHNIQQNYNTQQYDWGIEIYSYVDIQVFRQREHQSDIKEIKYEHPMWQLEKLPAELYWPVSVCYN